MMSLKFLIFLLEMVCGSVLTDGGVMSGSNCSSKAKEKLLKSELDRILNPSQVYSKISNYSPII